MHTSQNLGPGMTIAILLALISATYVGSYVVLVNPDKDAIAESRGSVIVLQNPDYLLGGDISACLFWPLEQLDRRLRPDAWWMC